MNSDLTKEQWQAIAEKLAGYLDKMCDYISNAEYCCGNCPFIDNCNEIGFMNAIDKAKKELGYE